MVTGTEDGVFMTDSPLPDSYDHHIRGWYIDAMEHKGSLTLSLPYPDASSGQEVLTLAKTLYVGRSDGVHTSDDQVSTVPGKRSWLRKLETIKLIIIRGHIKICNKKRLKLKFELCCHFVRYSSVMSQGWKLLTVRLSETGKNSGGQVKILGTFPKERLKFCLFSLVAISDTVMDRQK